ncbi:MAG: hypothetical protein IPP65_06955 [Chlorobi bacterium]|nr:hypothetical protein [Chlorobiota bacterium]
MRKVFIFISILSFCLCLFSLYYLGFKGNQVSDIEKNVKEFFGLNKDLFVNKTFKKEFSYQVIETFILNLNCSNFGIEVLHGKSENLLITVLIVGDSSNFKNCKLDSDYDSIKKSIKCSFKSTDELKFGNENKIIIESPNVNVKSQIVIENGYLNYKELNGDVEVNSVNSKIFVSDINGKILINSNHGDVFLERLNSNVDANCIGCKTSTNLNKGSFNLKSDGDIVIKKHFGNVKAISYLGEIYCELPEQSPACNLTSERGNVFIKMFNTVNVNLKLNAINGEIINTIPTDTISIKTPLKYFNETINGGGKTINAKSQGNISIQEIKD